MKYLYIFFYRLCGWKIKGEAPKDIKKYIIIVAPHTSNWDFMVGLGARATIGFDAKYIAKKELFRFPFGWLFRSLGGYPVDRSKSNNLVDSVVDIFNSKEEFIIALTPEGTRKYAPKWKTGFYYIALKAGIPVVMIAFDYPNKQVVLSDPLYLKGDFENELNFMMDYFRQFKGRNPEQGVL